MNGLNEIGFRHFIKRINMREQLIRNCEIIPLEVIVRNFSAGSFAKRLGVAEGTRCAPIVEYCYKDDALGDPLVTEEHIAAFGWASQQDMDDILALARVNDFMSGLMLGVVSAWWTSKLKLAGFTKRNFTGLLSQTKLVRTAQVGDIKTGEARQMCSDTIWEFDKCLHRGRAPIGRDPKSATSMQKPTLVN